MRSRPPLLSRCNVTEKKGRKYGRERRETERINTDEERKRKRLRNKVREREGGRKKDREREGVRLTSDSVRKIRLYLRNQ